MRRIGFVLVLVGMLLAVACQPEIVSHKVTILGLDGPLEKEVVHGGEFHLPAAPEKEGHTFDCITGGIEGHSYTPDTDIVVESDLTLDYNYKINRYSVKVLDGDEPLIDVTIDHGSTITLSAREPADGCHFVDVTDEEGNPYEVGTPIAVTSDLTLTYNFEINRYSVKVLDGDEPLIDREYNHGSTITLYDEEPPYGYHFVDVTDENGEEYPLYEEITVTGDLLLTYNWEINSYYVVVLIDGEDEPLIDREYKHGSTITLQTLEFPEGCHFVDVTDEYDEEYPLNEPIPVTEDLFLTYNWEANKYKVHIISGDENIPDTPVKHGETYTPERKTRSGYIFQSITDEAGNPHEAGVPITVASDLTLTYNWKTASYKIGDTGPAGGMIFYVDEGNEYPEWDYMETSTGEEGIGHSTFGYYYVDGYARAVGTETGLGTGKRNTEKLVEAMGDTAWNNEGNRNLSEYAAKMAADYEQNGYDDWFLPSKNELYLVYQNLQKPELFSFPAGFHWSSSEYSGGRAWDMPITNGDWYDSARYCDERIRPVRAF